MYIIVHFLFIQGFNTTKVGMIGSHGYTNFRWIFLLTQLLFGPFGPYARPAGLPPHPHILLHLKKKSHNGYSQCVFLWSSLSTNKLYSMVIEFHLMVSRKSTRISATLSGHNEKWNSQLFNWRSHSIESPLTISIITQPHYHHLLSSSFP